MFEFDNDSTSLLQIERDSPNSLIPSNSSTQQISSSTNSSQDTQVEVVQQQDSHDDNKVNLLIDKICAKDKCDDNDLKEESKNEREIDQKDGICEDEEQKQQAQFDPNLIFDQPDNDQIPDPRIILEQLKLLLQFIPDFNSVFPTSNFNLFQEDQFYGFNNDSHNNSMTSSTKPRGTLWDTIQEHIKINNHEVADGFIKDIVKRPQMLSFKWFVQKIFSQADPVKEILYEWLLNMNQNQAMYIEEIEKANQLLRESLWEMKKPETEPYLKLLTRESARIENKQYFKRRQAELNTLNQSESDINYQQNSRRAHSTKKYTSHSEYIDKSMNDHQIEESKDQTQLDKSTQEQKSSPSKVNITQNSQVNQSPSKIVSTDLQVQQKNSSKGPSPTKSQQSQGKPVTDNLEQDQTPSKRFFDSKLTTSCQIPKYKNEIDIQSLNQCERRQSMHREVNNTSRSINARQSRWQEPRANRNSNDMNRSFVTSQNFRNQRTLSPQSTSRRRDRASSLTQENKQANRNNQLYHYKESIGNKPYMNNTSLQYQPRMTKYQALQNYTLEYEDQNMYNNNRFYNGNKRYTGFQYMTHPSNYQQMNYNQRAFVNNRFYQNDNQNSYYDHNQSQYNNQRYAYNNYNKSNNFQPQQFQYNNNRQFAYQNQNHPRNYNPDYNNNNNILNYGYGNNYPQNNFNNYNNNNYHYNNNITRNSNYQRFNNSFQY